jgi:hypothetical protein
MPKDMEDAAFKAKKGDVLDPFKRPQGFLILKVDERWEAGTPAFDEVREQVQDMMARPQMDARMRPFLQKLRQEAFLEIKDGYVDSGAAPGKDTRWHDVAVLKPQTTTKEEVAAEHKRHKHLLFVPIPGTVSARGAKNTPIDTASLGERHEIAPATQPTVSTGTPEGAPSGGAGAPAGAPAGGNTAPGLTPANGGAAPSESASSSTTPSPVVDLPVEKGKSKKVKAASDKPEKPPTGSGSAAPIKQ